MSLSTNALPGQIALGCAALSMQDIPESTGLEVIRTAYDSGVRFFDTARVYTPVGDDTHNERLLRQALEGLPDVVISTKGGHWRAGERSFPVDNRPERLRQDAELSLRVLGLDRLPLYFVHRVDMDDVPIEDSVGELAALQSEGKIDLIGVSNVTADQIRRAAATTSIAAVQNRVSLRADPVWDPTVGVCEELGITMFGFAAFSNHPNDPDKRPLPEVLPNLALLAAARDVPLERLAVRAVLAAFPHLSLLVGARRPETAREAGAIIAELYDEELGAAYEADRALLVHGDYRQRPLPV